MILPLEIDGKYYLYVPYDNDILLVDARTFSEVISQYEDSAVPGSGNSLSKDSKKIVENAKKIKGIDIPDNIENSDLKKYVEQELDMASTSLVLCLTNSCNLNCKYCIQNSNSLKMSSKSMSEDIAIASIDKYIALSKGPIRISFYGGEPLLELPLIVSCIQYVKKKNKKRKTRFSITTNGTLLNKKVIQTLIDYECNIYISIDGDQENHDNSRRFNNGRGSFSKLIKNIKLLNNMDREYCKYKVGFNITYPLGELKKYVESIDRLIRKNQFVISSINISAQIPYLNLSSEHGSFGEDNEYLESLYRKIEHKLINNLPLTEIEMAIGFKDLVMIHKADRYPLGSAYLPSGMCIPSERKIFVKTNGDFCVCEKLHNDVDIGNYIEGVNRKKIFDYLDTWHKILNKRCLECWALRLCTICAQSGKRFDQLKCGMSEEELDYMCRITRNNVANSMVRYIKIITKNKKAFEAYSLQS